MKRILSLMLIIALLALTGCGRAGTPGTPPALTSGDTGELEWYLITEEFRPFGLACTVKGMARLDSHILFWGSDRHSPILGICDYQIGDDGSVSFSELQPVALDEPEARDEAFVYGVTAGGDGSFYVLTGEFPATYLSGGELKHNEDWDGSLRILRYSAEGVLLDSLALPQFYMESICSFCVLDAHSIAIFGNGDAALVGWDQGLRHAEELDEEQFLFSGQIWQGSIVLNCFSYRDGSSEFLKMDPESGSLTPLRLTENPSEFSMTVCQGLNEEYLIESGNRFYAADFASDKVEELMPWRYNTGEWTGECEYALRLGERCFLCQEPQNSAVTVARMAQRPAGERQTVQVAVYGEFDVSQADYLAEPVRAFDAQSVDYHYEITLYGPEDLDRLHTMFSTADAPDLLVFSGGISTVSDAFEDLYAYLDADPELSRESFLPRLLEDLSVGGELHELWSDASIYTLAARASDVGDGHGLTIEDYNRILQDNPKYQAVFQQFMSKDNLLRFVSTVGISHYIDRETGTCHFDDPSFRAMLDWCGQMGDELPEGKYDGRIYGMDEVVLFFEALQAPMQIPVLERNLSGEPFVFTGFPTGDDNGSFYTGPSLCMAIPSAAANKAGAWAFLRAQLLPGAQTAYRFPVNLEALKAVAQEDLNDEELAMLMDLMEHTGFAENIADDALRQIVIECGTAYLRGEKSLDETIQLLQSRASIYLSERYG